MKGKITTMKLIYSKKTDEKWQKIWRDTNLYSFDFNSNKPKLYLMEMFSYPSASNLHMGHWWNYSLPDTWGRMKSMQGYNVFHPMGFDSFGLPAENYAIKTGIHPKDSTENNIRTMEKQLSEIGCTYDWKHEIKTSDPSYYKWTQWLFLQMYKQGLAYKKEALVNWCPKCKTVLANEQASGGTCERCFSNVEQKSMSQWFFYITKYAEELLSDHDKLDWPEQTKSIQKNWIGKSTGVEVGFHVKNSEEIVKVFTTRVDTLLGLSYIVIAPESELVKKIVQLNCRESVEKYVYNASRMNEIERTSMAKGREKSGVFTGAYAIHPLTGKEHPIWISDYVIASYGTGAVMAVPAHDERDFEFATKYGLPIQQVVTSADEEVKLPFCEKGVLINSGKYDGMDFVEAEGEIVKDLKDINMGNKKVTFRLRDWSVSRQRYWGVPIPIVYCEHCGIVPVPEKDLPVELPYNIEFHPTGESPLASCEEYIHTKCPICNEHAVRETDTLDTFVCSSWYELRYLENQNDTMPWTADSIKIMPVDKYVGGIEHAAMHLLYCRFIYKALRDMGYVKGDEPYLSLIHQGIIYGTDGVRMSKSRGNTVAPDQYVEKYGSDVFRTYLAFGFDYSVGGAWKDSGIDAIYSFFGRFSRMVSEHLKLSNNDLELIEDDKLNTIQHRTIRALTQDVEVFHFNTAIARLMEFCTAIIEYQTRANRNEAFERQVVENFVKMIGIFAPHYGEEMWQALGNEYSLYEQPWPVYYENKIIEKDIEYAVQINSKVREKVVVSASIGDEEIQKIVLALPKIKAELEGKTIRKIIIIKKSLINIVV